MFKKILASIIVFMLILAMATASARAETLGPYLYTIIKALGVSNSTTADCWGMGGAWVASDTYASANPAALSGIEQPQVLLSQYNNTFDGGKFQSKFQVDQTNFRLMFPLCGFGVYTGITNVTSNTVRTTQLVPPFVSYIDVSGKEDDLIFCFGKKFGKNSPFSWGLSGAPKMSVNMDMNGPAGTFNGNISSKVRGGLAYGLLYQTKKFNMGLVYRGYLESATMTTYHFLVGNRIQEETFLSKVFYSGVQWKPSDRTKLALDWRNGTFSSRTYCMKIDTLHYGISQRFSKFEIQAGVNDTQPTFGFSYTNGGFDLGLVYLQNREKKTLGDFFGNSGTYGLELNYRF